MAYWLIPATISAAAFAVGHLTRTRGWLNRWLVLAVVVAMALFGWFALGMYESDVSTGQATQGLAIAVLGLGAVPVIGYYALGRVLDTTWLAAVLWSVGVVPLSLYMVFGWIVVAGLMGCTPDDYECPI